MKSIFLFILFVFSPSVFSQESVSSATVLTKDIPREITVYRSPTCQCCHKWIEHLKDNNFNVIDKLSNDMASVKETLGLPNKMTSCHTAVIDGYIIEGHVPATDIESLLFNKPAIAGLSVPKMPVGTPGMEMGPRKDPFIVFQFDKQGGYSVFQQYELDQDNNYTSQPATVTH